MENIVEKISQELENNPELNEDINDIGLPKSSLHSFVKEFLTKNKVRGDKNIIPMLDKISRYYVTFISKVGAQICEDWKKKTLNLEHIFEALKRLNFHKHIELLAKESKNEDNNEKDEDEDDEKKFENKNLKQMINRKKKRGGRKKKYYENEDEKNDMIEAENKIFEEARQEMLNEERLLNRDINNGNEDENNFIQKENEEKEGNDNLKEDDKEKNDESVKMEKNLFIDNGGEEDINFD
jgi:histone H3/H4